MAAICFGLNVLNINDKYVEVAKEEDNSST